MANRTGFTHRMVSGWISDYSSIPRLEPWPSITLDKQMEADLVEAFDKAHAVGYTGMILWGLLAGKSWHPFLPQTVDEDRKRRVLRVMEEVRKRGMKAIMGLGLYSWGFDAIIAAHPELDGGAPDKMCGIRPESWEWMRKVVDYILLEYDPDGVSMQSSDQGRCPCDACQEMSPLEFHATINDQVAAYIRSNWPDKLIEISTWGMDLGNPNDLSYVQKMTAHADILNDFNNSSARNGRANRKALIENLKCAFGTEQGWWVDPPPFWERMKWFLPISRRNIPYLKELFEDGGRAVQRYILPLANPGAEVGFLFDGILLQDVYADPDKTLADVLQQVFEPRRANALQGLVDTWVTVEDGYLDNIPPGAYPHTIHTNNLHYTFSVPPPDQYNRPEYLLRMKAEKLAAYAESLETGLKLVQAIRPDLNNAAKALCLERTMRMALAEAEQVRALKLSPVGR